MKMIEYECIRCISSLSNFSSIHLLHMIMLLQIGVVLVQVPHFTLFSSVVGSKPFSVQPPAKENFSSSSELIRQD